MDKVKHWTLADAEAAEREKREAIDQMIRAKFVPKRNGLRGLFRALWRSVFGDGERRTENHTIFGP